MAVVNMIALVHLPANFAPSPVPSRRVPPMRRQVGYLFLCNFLYNGIRSFACDMLASGEARR